MTFAPRGALCLSFNSLPSPAYQLLVDPPPPEEPPPKEEELLLEKPPEPPEELLERVSRGIDEVLVWAAAQARHSKCTSASPELEYVGLRTTSRFVCRQANALQAGHAVYTANLRPRNCSVVAVPQAEQTCTS